jgi:ABC-type amino acid transport substrate-binding protein
MKKIVITLSLALVAAVTLGYMYKSSKGSSNSHTDNLLLVGTNAHFPPFEFMENGKIVGFEIELMDAIGKRLVKGITFKEMPFDSLLIEAQSGRIHIIASGMTPTAERSKQVFFTKPYLQNDPLVVITLAQNAPQSLAELNGKETVVNDGFTAESFMKQHKDVILRSLATPAEAFLALTNGRAYAYVSARSAVQPLFDRYGQEKFNILTLPVSDSYALAVPKQFPEIFKQIQGALEALENDGTLLKLKKKWHLDF